eukprot:CAMPEP_0174709500 /NCGR_PEP_ID=MMETSP1094-20130205/11433_1 /TAXON_ID=156173 /ORGANISM="Chrysochromulina brevifilum, Strain UTEX LB 985" /LENGTH=92 /DNA_ID=CAMNT_0015908185 /DNA_START=389 /DNA_END=664 /DNA_ORIENTATION=-
MPLNYIPEGGENSVDLGLSVEIRWADAHNRRAGPEAIVEVMSARRDGSADPDLKELRVNPVGLEHQLTLCLKSHDRSTPHICHLATRLTTGC